MLTAFGASVNDVNRNNLTPLALSKSKATKYFLRKMDSWTGVSYEETGDFGFTLVPDPSSPTRMPVVSEAVDSTVDQTRRDQVDASVEASYRHARNHGELPLSPQGREEVDSEQVQLLKSVGGSVVQDTIQSNGTHLPKEKIPYEDNFLERKQYLQLDDMLRKQVNDLDSISTPDEIVACHKQRKELAIYKRTGNRILCLDGGGMKALVELDVLSSIEKHTGKKITELFDWIVGTSTGGIIALGLVYGEWLPT